LWPGARQDYVFDKRIDALAAVKLIIGSKRKAIPDGGAAPHRLLHEDFQDINLAKESSKYRKTQIRKPADLLREDKRKRDMREPLF
jgi:hypothetical protein